MEIIKREKITKEQVLQLAKILGIGAILLDLGNTDLSRGRSVYKKDGQMGALLWTKDGKRMNICQISGGGFIATMGKEPDPERPDILSP